MNTKIARGSAILVFLLLLAALTIIYPAPAQAHSNCQNTYVVQRGDHLLQIARKLGISFNELMSLNPQLWYNPNFIYPGQVLCVPNAAPPPPPPPKQGTSVVVDLYYVFNPDDPDKSPVFGPLPDPWPSDRVVAKRIVIPLDPMVEKDLLLGTGQFMDVFNKLQDVRLVAVESKTQPGAMDLVAIGAKNVALFNRFGFLNQPVKVPSTSAPGSCVITPLTDAMGVKSTTGTVALEDNAGYQHQFPINGLVVLPSVADLPNCYPQYERMLFALTPSALGNGDQYHATVLLTDPSNPGGPTPGVNAGYYPPQSYFGQFLGYLFRW